MSHYDCSNCGASGGIAYGYCTSCTPKEVLRAKKDLDNAYKEAQNLWEQQNRKARQSFIAAYVKKRKQHYQRLYKQYLPNKEFL